MMNTTQQYSAQGDSARQLENHLYRTKLMTIDADRSFGDTLRFFNTVWPRQGVLYVVFKTRDGWVHRVVQNALDAAKLIVDAPDDVETYFACASYLNNSSRKGGNVAWVRVIWLDVDVGDDKPYATQAAAVLAIKDFCRRVGLPIPLIVSSGNGIHIYWLLDADVTPVVWKALADALEAGCRTHGLAPDHARTGDIASILRPVGSTNKKGAHQPVRWLRSVTIPISPDKFAASFRTCPRQNGEGSLDLTGSIASNAWLLLSANKNTDLTAGVAMDWFDFLTPSQKDACLAEMLALMPDLANGTRDEWLRIVAASARSGAPGARELCRQWSKLSPTKYRAGDFEAAFNSFVED